MAALNKAMLIGNLGKDPDVRYSQDGVAVTNFSLATTDRWKDKATGENREKTEWHRIVAFGRLGEICGEYLTKGQQVYIEGRLRTTSWEKDGVTRYATQIEAVIMQMLGPRPLANGFDNQSQSVQNQSNGGKHRSPNPANNQDEPPDFFEDDIPF